MQFDSFPVLIKRILHFVLFSVIDHAVARSFDDFVFGVGVVKLAALQLLNFFNFYISSYLLKEESRVTQEAFGREEAFSSFVVVFAFVRLLVLIV